MSDQSLSSRVPYLFRAMHEWIVDNDQTPYVVIDSSAEGLQVPVNIAVDDRIILNISVRAVEHLNMSNDGVSFVARFSGVSESIYLPTHSIVGIYAKESGEGMIFAGDQIAADASTDDDNSDPPDGGGRPALRIVK